MTRRNTMKISEAIRLLQTYKADEDIIIAWWDKDAFEDKEEFSIALENEDSIEWSDIHDQLTNRNN